MGLVGTFPFIKLENEACEAMATERSLSSPPSFLSVRQEVRQEAMPCTRMDR